MKEIEKQFLFSQLLAKLILFAYDKGFTITLGEAYRPPETAELYAKQGIGISNSLHRRRLAIDLNLFKDGSWLTDIPSYKILGDYWKSLSGKDHECAWGGDFKSRDLCHFSIEHLGSR